MSVLVLRLLAMTRQTTRRVPVNYIRTQISTYIALHTAHSAPDILSIHTWYIWIVYFTPYVTVYVMLEIPTEPDKM